MQHGTTQTLHTYSACKTLLDKEWELEGKWGDDREGEKKYLYINIHFFSEFLLLQSELTIPDITQRTRTRIRMRTRTPHRMRINMFTFFANLL